MPESEPFNNDDRLVDLLIQAEDWQQQGRRFSVEDLCPDAPELWPTLNELLAEMVQLSERMHIAEAISKTELLGDQRYATSPAVRPGSVRGYEIIEEIGRGGMGVVYKARQVSLNRLVALKMVLAGAHASPQERARFRQEAEAVARLLHPNIVQIHEVGEHDGMPFFSMEYVEGGSLAQYLDGQPLAHRPVVEMVETLARTIHAAHEQGIIHRDLKPANILLAPQISRLMTNHDRSFFGQRKLSSVLADGRSPAWDLKITDFGLAKRVDGTTVPTVSQGIAGSPSYMAPEQVRSDGGRVARQSDIYALGVIMYELLTGRVPFKGENAMDTVLQVLQQEPVPPSRLRPKLPRDLETICLKCLARQPARRYSTAAALADDLRLFLDSRPIEARPVGGIERLWRWSARNRAVATLAGMVLLLLLAGVLLSAIGYLREAELRGAAEQQREIARIAEANARAEADRTRDLLYIANMNLVVHDWQTGNAARLQQVLAETQDHPKRGFEWAYWQRRSRPDWFTLRGHSNVVHAVAYSPDGTRVATGSADHTAKIWDAVTGREVATLLGHGSEISSVAFSPDNSRIVTAARDRTARVWSASTGQQLMVLKGKSRVVLSASYSPDGTRIITGHGNGFTMRWDAESGAELSTVQTHSGGVWCAVFSPDGRRFATAGEDGSAKVWDVATGQEVYSLKGTSFPVYTVAFSADGSRLLTAGFGWNPRIWDSRTGQLLREFGGHRGILYGAVLSRDGNYIASCGRDRLAKIHEVTSGREVQSIGHTGEVRAVAFSPDGERIITGGADGVAQIWATVPRQPRVLAVRGPSDSQYARSLAITRDGACIVASLANAVAVYDGTMDHEVQKFDTPGGTLSVAVSADGDRIATGGAEGAQVWDAKTARLLFDLKGHSEPVYALVFAPDGRTLVTGSDDGTARVWELSSGVEQRVLHGHTGAVRALAFSSDGRLLVTGSHDVTAKLWDTETYAEIRTLKGHGAGVTSVAISPDGGRIAVGSFDGTTSVWDARSCELNYRLHGHANWVVSVAFSPDGERILTGSVDSTARLCDTETGQEVLMLPGHDSGTAVALFTPDGQRIVTREALGTIRVWEAASPDQIAAWKTEEQLARELIAKTTEQQSAMARAEGFIQDWLVLAPIPLGGLGAGLQNVPGVRSKVLSDEVAFIPRAGDCIAIDGRDYQWREHHTQHCFLDFNTLLDQNTEFSVAYAACYVVADRERHGLKLKVGSDDSSRVYLNGIQVYENVSNRLLMQDDDTVEDIELHAGTNVLIFKVANERLEWKGCLRLVDQNDQPLTDVRVQLEP